MKKKTTKKKKIKLDLDLKTMDYLREIVKLSGVCIDDVIAVILTSYLIAEKNK